MRLKLIEFIKKNEGFKSKPYYCTANKLSIGFGRNLDSNGISEDEAETMLQNDIDNCMAELSRNLPEWYDFPEPAQIAVLDMCYNLGISGFLQFKKTINHLKKGEYKQAGVECLKSKWSDQVGARAIRISKLFASC